MGSSTEKLQQLRPVTFKLKTDRQAPVQYGLIAEEVDKVYPELVIHNAEGQIDGVRYDELAPMLLNQVQLQQKEIAELKAGGVAQSTQIADQAQQLQQMRQQLTEMRALKQNLADLVARGDAGPRSQPASLQRQAGL